MPPAQGNEIPQAMANLLSMHVPGIQELANQRNHLQGYNPFAPSCSPEMDSSTHEEAIHGQWSFFLCREETFDDCHPSPKVYAGEQAAVYAATGALRASGGQYYATGPEPVRLMKRLEIPGFTAGQTE
jgi:hypothetical protein